MAKQATQEVLEFPSGGIADFYMEDHEIEALEAEEAEEAFGSAGIATFKPIASRMASYGRYGDDTVAHVETGELVVPKALIDQNPKLRDSIFSHLRELGVEDPERYVVGSGANSLNPETGLPEFFFKKIFRGIKKAASKVAKGVSKAVKSVAKVIKKAAPVIIPFALNAMFPGLGAIYSGALGSGIGTLVQGGSLKDAFKNALIGGAIGGATAAIGGGMSAAAKPGGSFAEGAVSGIKKAADLGNLTTAGKQLVSGQFGQAGLDAVNVTNPITAEAAMATDVVNTAQLPADASTTDLFGVNRVKAGFNTPSNTDSLAAIQDRVGNLGQNLSGPAPAADPSKFMIADQAKLSAAAQPPSFIDSAQNLYNEPSLANLKELTFGAEPMTASEVLANAGYNPAAVSAESALGKAAEKAALESAGTLTRNFAIPATVATIGGGIALNKMMGDGDDPDDPTTEDLQEQLGPTGGQLIAQNPGQYLVTGNTEVPVGSTGKYVIPTDFAYAGQNYYNQNPFLRARGLGGTPFVQQAAEGGQIFPRRVGGIMPNEGVPGQDSVRAMLMPGEFVMTTDAVRGLGNGNNERGINRMYDMMRGLEAKGKAMA